MTDAGKLEAGNCKSPFWPIFVDAFFRRTYGFPLRAQFVHAIRPYPPTWHMMMWMTGILGLGYTSERWEDNFVLTARMMLKWWQKKTKDD